MDRIDKFFYINLSERTDRRELIEKELEKLQIPKEKCIRFEAIKDNNGCIGCAKSHFSLVKKFLESDDKVWSIMEDDLFFIKDKNIINLYINDFLDDKNAHFFNGSVTSLQKSNYSLNLNKINSGYTTGWYILKKEFAPLIFDSFFESVTGLLKGYNYAEYACDVVWSKYYNEYNFVTSKELLAIQRPSRSDIFITGGIVDYTSLYINYEN